jgi:hypothetical protein
MVSNDDIKKLFASPKEGEKEVKMIQGTEYKWCGKFHRWKKGDRAHTTSEHVVGFKHNQESTSDTDNNRSTQSDDSRNNVIRNNDCTPFPAVSPFIPNELPLPEASESGAEHY